MACAGVPRQAGPGRVHPAAVAARRLPLTGVVPQVIITCVTTLIELPPLLTRFEQGMDALCRLHPDLPRPTVSRVRLLQHGARELSDHLERFFAGHGVSATGWIALVILYAHPEPRLNPSFLAASLVQSRTHVTRVLDDLAAKGLLERSQAPGDRRRVDVAITAEGRGFVRAVLPRVWECYAAALEIFTEDEAQTLEKLMRKLLRHLEASPGAPELP